MGDFCHSPLRKNYFLSLVRTYDELSYLFTQPIAKFIKRIGLSVVCICRVALPIQSHLCAVLSDKIHYRVLRVSGRLFSGSGFVAAYHHIHQNERYHHRYDGEIQRYEHLCLGVEAHSPLLLAFLLHRQTETTKNCHNLI